VKNKDQTLTLDHAIAKNLSFDWDVGLRVGAGYNLPHDDWDIHLTWLRFYTDAHRHQHVKSTQEL